jgi:hypothetical protein
MHDIQIVSILVDGRVLEQALFRGNMHDIMHDIQSVRIESSRADVTHWRIIDRTSGVELTPYIDYVDVHLSPEEGIIARLHFKNSTQGVLVEDTAIALTAIAEVMKDDETTT